MIVFLKNIRTIKKVFNIKPSNGSLDIRIYFTEVNNSPNEMIAILNGISVRNIF
jgi:hypothetical protein